MNLPNLLTLSRILMALALGSLLQWPGTLGALLAIGIFVLASFTDYFDGYLARKYDLITTCGKIMDPIADKVLILTALFVFAFQGLIPLWLVLLIAVREVAVTAVRMVLLMKGSALPAEQAGKVKTVVQIGTVGVILLYRLLATWPVTAASTARLELLLQMVMLGLVIVAVVLTLWSGYSFFRNMAAQEVR